jgi:hypothetical protein
MDFNDPAIKTMGLRITMTLMIINATATWMILAMPEFPPIAALFHGILALIMGMRMVMIATGQNPPVHK